MFQMSTTSLPDHSYGMPTVYNGSYSNDYIIIKGQTLNYSKCYSFSCLLVAIVHLGQSPSPTIIFSYETNPITKTSDIIKG